jgi:hypothetical protein
MLLTKCIDENDFFYVNRNIKHNIMTGYLIIVCMYADGGAIQCCTSRARISSGRETRLFEFQIWTCKFQV